MLSILFHNLLFSIIWRQVFTAINMVPNSNFSWLHVMILNIPLQGCIMNMILKKIGNLLTGPLRRVASGTRLCQGQGLTRAVKNTRANDCWGWRSPSFLSKIPEFWAAVSGLWAEVSGPSSGMECELCSSGQVGTDIPVCDQPGSG